MVKDCDPNTGEPDEEGYEDEYQLEDVSVSPADYMLSTYLGDFEGLWRELGPVAAECERKETFELPLSVFGSLQEAVDGVLDLLGMQAVDDAAEVKQGSKVHQLRAMGLWVGGIKVAVRCRMAMQPAGITMEMQIRSEHAHVSEAVMSVIG